MSTLDMATLVLSAMALMIGLASAAIAWRTWRRLALLRLHFDRTDTERGRLERQVVDLHKRLALQRAGADAGRNGIPVQLLSQHGDDALAWELLGEPRDGFFIEAGAHDGRSLSNTYFLESLGWNGLLVEPHPELAEACRLARPGSRVVQAALGDNAAAGNLRFHMVRGAGGVDALSFSRPTDYQIARVEREGGIVQAVDVPHVSLDRLLEQSPPARVDFVSLDVEGAELEVLRGFDIARWQPRLLAIEDNSAGQDRRVAEYIEQFGYTKVARCGCNDFYQRDVGARLPDRGVGK